MVFSRIPWKQTWISRWTNFSDWNWRGHREHVVGLKWKKRVKESDGSSSEWGHAFSCGYSEWFRLCPKMRRIILLLNGFCWLRDGQLLVVLFLFSVDSSSAEARASSSYKSVLLSKWTSHLFSLKRKPKKNRQLSFLGPRNPLKKIMYLWFLILLFSDHMKGLRAPTLKRRLECR